MAQYWVNNDADGDWAAANNWASTSGGSDNTGPPASTDEVILDSAVTDNCNVGAAGAVAASTTLSSGYTGTLSVNQWYSLLVNGNLAINDGTLNINNNANCFVRVTDGNISVGAGGTLTGGASGHIEQFYNDDQTTRTIQGVIGANYVPRVTSFSTIPTLQAAGNVTFSRNVTYHNSSNEDLNFDSNDFDISFAGDVDFTVSGSIQINWVTGTGQVTVNGSAAQSVNFGGAALDDVSVINTSATVALAGDFTTHSYTQAQNVDISGAFTITANPGAIAIDGASGNRCTITDTDFDLTNSTGATATYTDLTNSTCTGGTGDATDNCTETGVCTGWNFSSGRIMSSLANHGGLAGQGGVAGQGGGLAG